MTLTVDKERAEFGVANLNAEKAKIARGFLPERPNQAKNETIGKLN
jgi:hypothetical protein